MPLIVPGENKLKMVLLNSLEDFHSLKTNRWGILEPRLEENREDVLDDPAPKLDLLIVPGLAFDRQGRRLGRGKGYYDRYIASLEQRLSIKPKIAGLAYRVQLVEEVPVGPNDKLLDAIITADEIIQTN